MILKKVLCTFNECAPSNSVILSRTFSSEKQKYSRYVLEAAYRIKFDTFLEILISFQPCAAIFFCRKSIFSMQKKFNRRKKSQVSIKERCTLVKNHTIQSQSFLNNVLLLNSFLFTMILICTECFKIMCHERSVKICLKNNVQNCP